MTRRAIQSDARLPQLKMKKDDRERERVQIKRKEKKERKREKIIVRTFEYSLKIITRFILFSSFFFALNFVFLSNTDDIKNAEGKQRESVFFSFSKDLRI